MPAKRLVLLISTLLLSFGLGAATVEERSPFRQGHWWDPSRSGHGFEILNNAAGDVFVVWYTYDSAGQPTWYTAQGTRNNLGEPWALQKHRWANGAIAASATVGSLKLSANHFERLAAAWTLEGAQGTWVLEPFVQSGTTNEVDLTGHWYAPANSGWGMTLLDQGDVFGAVIYAYDAAGAPTWAAGFDRGKGKRVDLYRTRGTCPSCTYQPPSLTAAGAIDISHAGDNAVTVRGALAIPLADGLRIDGAQARQLGRPASQRSVDYQLATFARPETLRSFLASGMEYRYFASAGADFSPAPPSAAPTSFSTTNVQEAGVDEADVLKTDGRYAYAITPTTYGNSFPYSASRAVRIAWVGGGAGVEAVGQLPLYASQGYMGEAGLFLHANNLVTLASGYYYGGWYYSPSWTAETTLEILDLTNPAYPSSRWRAKLSGSLVSSRRVGDRLYVVTRFTPDIPGYINYAWTDAQRATNRGVLEAAPLSAFLPKISVNGAEPWPAVGHEQVYAPQLGATRPLADMIVVTVVDIRQAAVVQALAIVGRTDAMYMSNANLYLASSRYEMHPLARLVPSPAQASLLNTDIHQLAVVDSGLRVAGTGSIEGWVGWGDKASFRFGENAGRLGVVSSVNTGWWGPNANRVTLLEPSSAAPGLLKTVSYLPNSRRPEPLGKPNEQLYATRFVGDKLYAVTFRQIDPLYIVDLANASDPRITGELELPGFSDYLHPLGDGLLLGFGREARGATNAADGNWAWFQGLQLSLFDVSGAAPRELQRMVMGKRGSQSALFSSHHAFSALKRPDGTTTVAFPASINEGVPVYGSGDSAWYSWSYSGLLHFDISGSTPADARLSQSRTLMTMQSYGGTSTSPPNGEGWWDQGRSILFPEASVYYSAGKFWRQNAAGITSGPY